MTSPTYHVRKLAAAELHRAELEARRVGRRLVLVGIAAIITFIAVVMLTVSGFLALSDIYGYPIGALITAAVLAVVAAAALGLASRGPSRSRRLEIELANRNVAQARAEISNEFDEMDRKFNDMTFGLFNLKGSGGGLSFTTILLGVLAAVSPSLRNFILPLLPFLLRKN